MATATRAMVRYACPPFQGPGGCRSSVCQAAAIALFDADEIGGNGLMYQVRDRGFLTFKAVAWLDEFDAGGDVDVRVEPMQQRDLHALTRPSLKRGSAPAGWERLP